MTPTLQGAKQEKGNHYPIHIASNVYAYVTNGKERVHCAVMVGRQPPRLPSPQASSRGLRSGALTSGYHIHQQTPCPDTIAG